MTRTRRIVAISVLCCLSVVLDIIKEFIPFINMPGGGSINISLIPIVVCSFTLGLKDGMVCSILSYLMSTILGLNSYFLNIFQYLFDYIIPTICVGLCAIFYKNKNIKEMVLGIIVAMILRFLSIVISGAYFWLDSTVIAGSKEAFIASSVINFPYSLGTMIVLLISVPLIVKVINKYLL